MWSRGLACLMLVAAMTGATLAQGTVVPHRVYATSAKAFTSFDAMLDDLVKADVVFVGEQHNDANTHRWQLALLEAIAKRRSGVMLALEMFERDAQEPLEHFLMGHTDEVEFLRESRNGWPRYQTDYKPLVDLAIARQWPVIAANVPRDIAGAVATGGLEVLKTRPEREKSQFAAEVQCPSDGAYYRRFVEAMGGGHNSGGSGPAMEAATVERYYGAQCLKDETMGESIAQAYAGGAVRGASPLVVMMLGAFHSDFSLGTVERTARRMPGKRLAVVTVLPVDAIDSAAPAEADLTRAQFLVYVNK